MDMPRQIICIALLLAIGVGSSAWAQNAVWETYFSLGTRAYADGNAATAESNLKEALAEAEKSPDRLEERKKTLTLLETVQRQLNKTAEADETAAKLAILTRSEAAPLKPSAELTASSPSLTTAPEKATATTPAAETAPAAATGKENAMAPQTCPPLPAAGESRGTGSTPGSPATPDAGANRATGSTPDSPATQNAGGSSTTGSTPDRPVCASGRLNGGKHSKPGDTDTSGRCGPSY